MASLVLDPASPTHAADVIASIIPKIRAMAYLKGLEGRPQFSIRDWVRDDNRRGWVFIRVAENQLNACGSIVSAWVDVFIKSLLSLPKSNHRRIHAMIDELQSFDKISSLSKAAAEGRKYGLNLMLGFTSMTELSRRDKYGSEATKAMLSMLGTKIVFNVSEAESAKWCADLFGEEDTKLSTTNMSSGKNDNVSFGDDRRRHHIVLPSEIQSLREFDCYVRFSGDWPTTLVQSSYQERPTIAEVDVPRKIPEPRISSLAEERCEGTNNTRDEYVI